jgi:hypothetical protein
MKWSTSELLGAVDNYGCTLMVQAVNAPARPQHHCGANNQDGLVMRLLWMAEQLCQFRVDDLKQWREQVRRRNHSFAKPIAIVDYLPVLFPQ